MMKFMMRAILMLAIGTVMFTSCTKDEDKRNTNATIVLLDRQGRPVKGIVVYAYTEDTWMVMGDNPFFADGQASSNANGEAIFSNIEYPTCFNGINNYQNTFRFSAHYTHNLLPKIKVIAVTFNKGDSKKETIILN